MVARRVQVRSVGDVDRHVARLPWVRFTRRHDGLFLECDRDEVGRVTVLLARAGLALEPAETLPQPPSLVAAVVTHLAPFGRDDIVDVVTISAASLGDSTAWARRRRRPSLLGRNGAWRRSTRALLHGDDVAFHWCRVVFAGPGLLRERALAGARPVVFDRDATIRRPQELALAGNGALAAWVRP
ncbi:MAG TPA: hypothetical protein VFV20_05400 [Candidatus Limnocylindria bacterium]|nr:hypothetical protein [Candidatus Limnocylindria bacterium]